MKYFKVLSTKYLKPLLIKEAKQAGIKIYQRPFIRTSQLLEKVINEKVDHLINRQNIPAAFTSSKSVESIYKLILQSRKLSAEWKVYSLSGKTFESLSTLLPAAKVAGTAHNAGSLAKKIIKDGIKELAFFSSNNRLDELPAMIKEQGITLHEIVVYKTVKVPTLYNEDLDGILFFSPSAVESFFSLNQLNDNTVCFAIGKTTASSLKTNTVNKIVTCEVSTQEIMIKTLKTYFNTNS